jgi:hypothetical protein
MATLEHSAVVAPRGELAAAVRERYAGLMDRGGYFEALTPGDAAREAWRVNSARIILV